MKISVFHSALFALIGLVLSPLAVVHASSPPADRVHKCARFDYEKWRRDHPRPASKRLADLDVGEPRTVRMIYFLPNNRPYRAAAVDTMKKRMRQAQDFFAKQMKANRQGNTTIRFEADAQGEPQVLRVDGQHRTKYYNTDRTVAKVLEEIDPVFDMYENVYYVAIDNGNDSIYKGDKAVGGVGSRWGKNGGWGMVPISADFGTVAHELGHAFGLEHDFRDDAYVMSYGFIPDWLSADQRLSACNAEYLAVHTYFNPNSPIREGSWPTIEENTSSPIHISAGTTSIPVQVKVRDSDGLHQAILLAETQAPHFAEGFFEVKACRGLKDRTAPVVEFDYDGTVPSLRESDFNTFETQGLVISAVDASGEVNFSGYFELINTGFRAPITTFSPSYKDGFFVSPFFSPDGRLLALEASYGDDRVKLWDVVEEKSIATLPWRGMVEMAALSPDGRLLALEVLDGPAIKLWDVSSSRKLVSIDEPHGINEYYPDDEGSVVSSLSFSPDGKLLASGGRNDDMVKLWDVSSGKRVATLVYEGLYGGSITSLVFSPTGRLLASGSAGKIELWDVSSRKRIRTIDAHDSMEWHGLSFSPDGKLLASGGKVGDSYETKKEEGEVKLWDVSTGEPIATLFGSAPVSFSPDGKLASASGSKTVWVDLDGLEGGTSQGETYGGSSVKLWDVSTGEPIASLPPYSVVRRMAFSRDGKLLAEKSRDIRLWDVSEWIGEGTITIGQETTASDGEEADGEDDGEIADDEMDEVSVGLPEVTLRFSDHTVSEAVGRVEVVVLLSETIDEAVSVGYATFSQTATAGEDYRSKNRTLVIPAGSKEKTIRISIIDDDDVEDEEYFEFRLKESNIENATLGDPSRSTVTIMDNDGAAKVAAFPNPFNGMVQIAYAIPVAGEAVLDIYNVLGQRVQSLADGYRDAGLYQATWDAKDEAGQAVSAGIYFVKMRHEKGVLTQRLLYLP